MSQTEEYYSGVTSVLASMLPRLSHSDFSAFLVSLDCTPYNVLENT
jgi:hypothetical protein